MKLEGDREGGSPTTRLLTHWRTSENVVPLRTFVQVLLDLKQNDIANDILEKMKEMSLADKDPSLAARGKKDSSAVDAGVRLDKEQLNARLST